MRVHSSVAITVGALSVLLIACATKSSALVVSNGSPPRTLAAVPSAIPPAIPTFGEAPPAASGVASKPPARVVVQGAEPRLELVDLGAQVQSLAQIDGALLLFKDSGKPAKKVGDSSLTIGVATDGDSVTWLTHEPLRHPATHVVGRWPDGFEFAGNWGQHLSWKDGKLVERALAWPTPKLVEETTPPGLLGLVKLGDRTIGIAKHYFQAILQEEPTVVFNLGAPGALLSLKRRSTTCSAQVVAGAKQRLSLRSNARFVARLKAAASRGAEEASAELERMKGGLPAYLPQHEVHPMTFGQTGDGKPITAGRRCDETWATEIWQADGSSEVLPLPLGVDDRILTSAKLLPGPSGGTWLVTLSTLLRLSDGKWTAVDDLTTFDSRYTRYSYGAAAVGRSCALFVEAHGNLYKRHREKWSHVEFSSPDKLTAQSIALDPKGRLWAVATKRWSPNLKYRVYRQRTPSAD